MDLSQDIAAQERACAGHLVAIALFIDDPAEFPGELPKRRHAPTRTGRVCRVAMQDARRLAQQWGECFIAEQRYDERGRHIVSTVIKRVGGAK